MSELLLYLGVFVGAAAPVLEVWLAVPLGVLAGLPWLPAALVGFVGNLATLLPVIYAGDKVKSWIKRWRKQAPPEGVDAADGQQARNADGKQSRNRVLFDRLGVPGLAFLGPFLIGVHAASALAIAAGANRRAVVLWFLFQYSFVRFFLAC